MICLPVCNSQVHIVIDAEIQISTSMTVATGCVLEFCGGCFKAVGASTADEKPVLNLNGAQIRAPRYCIFDGIAVTGFRQTEVYPEWFQDAEHSANHQCINTAIEAANGCPVVLGFKTYKLQDSIIVPKNRYGKPQILKVLGALDVSSTENVTAIVVHGSRVALRIQRITGWTGSGRQGIGIQLEPGAHFVDIEVVDLVNLHKGLFFPLRTVSPLNGVQNGIIKFQKIMADTCIEATIVDHAGASISWLHSMKFIGGRVMGYDGISLSGFNALNPNYKGSVQTLTFTNIGFEGVTHMPLLLENAQYCQFSDCRMNESLPGLGNPQDLSKTWISFNRVANVSLNAKAMLHPYRFRDIKDSDNVKIQGAIFLDAEAFDAYWPLFDCINANKFSVYDASENSMKYASVNYLNSNIQGLNVLYKLSDNQGEVGAEWSMLDIMASTSVRTGSILSTLVVEIKYAVTAILNLAKINSMVFPIRFMIVRLTSNKSLTIKYRNQKGDRKCTLTVSGLYRVAVTSDFELSFILIK